MEVVYQKNDEEKMMMKKKKRTQAMHVIKVVLYMLRRNRRRKSLNTGFWQRLMDSIRPMKSSNIAIMPPPVPPQAPTPAIDDHRDLLEEQLSEVEDVFTAVASDSSSAPQSQYGSADCLSEMDINCDYDHDHDYDDDDDDEEEEEEYGGDVDVGDEMIDVKAEEFIKKFYAQMRMQNQAYMERYNAKLRTHLEDHA